MFADEPDTAGHDGLCQGRTRSFPHVRGNWATFVFLKCKKRLTVSVRGTYSVICAHSLCIMVCIHV